MKEATGELNMTVITVVAIAAVAALFTLFVWPNIQANILLSTACTNVNSSGKYSSAEAGIDGENSVNCENFNCTAIYNGKTYTRDCTDQ